MSKIIVLKEGGQTKYYRLARKKVNVPPYGILSEDELLANTDALKSVLKNRGGLKLLQEVAESEYQAELAKEQEAAAEAAKAAEEAKAAQELKEYQAAKAIVEAYEAKHEESDSLDLPALQAQYEELTGKKAGNMKAKTLQSKIEEFNAKKD